MYFFGESLRFHCCEVRSGCITTLEFRVVELDQVIMWFANKGFLQLVRDFSSHCFIRVCCIEFMVLFFLYMWFSVDVWNNGVGFIQF